jgi:eukaryotic-like serine/threonine-protein kinase
METGDKVGAYILASQLGRGETGSTWKAAREGEGRTVALKVLDIGLAKGWSGAELFGREIEALRTLSHPGIPRFIESFEDDAGGDTRLVLAMELAPGESLESLVAGGRRFSDAEISAILAGLCDILAYLGSLRPAVIHRDVNPRNILLDAGGKVSLVDFSGAQEALRLASNPGATLIGTPGYIPLEQISGRASPRSDLYGAAATALFLLTRRNPAELPLKALKPDLSSIPSLGPALSAVLSSWLDPDEERRGISASDAAKMLRGEIAPPLAATAGQARGPEPDIVISLDEEAPRLDLPSDSRIKIAEEAGRLAIELPPAGLSNPSALGIGGFSIFWLGFVAFWTFSAAAMGAPIFFVLFSLPFWGVGIFMARSSLAAILGRSTLILDAREGISLNQRMIGKGRTRSWPIGDLGACRVEKAAVQARGASDKELVIEAGAKSLRIGKSLSERELAAVAGRIERWRRSQA